MPSPKSGFVPLGHPDNPRWLAPAGYRLRLGAFAGWRPYKLSSRLAWAAIKPAVRWGAAPATLADDHLYVRCIADLDWRALGWRRPSEPEPLVYIGTPSPRRKVIVHLIDPASHACELIVKAPLTEAARWAIRHEAQTLVQLQQEQFTAAPRLVELHEAAGVASQTVVSGPSAGLKCSREIAMLLRSLKRREECLSLTEFAASFASRAPHLATGESDAGLLARALDEMKDPSPLPAVRIHGDFAPWNIKLPNGAAALVDWEDSQPRGLPLHDAYHFVHIARCLFGKRPRPLWQELRFRYDFDLTAAQRRKLELAYLVQMLFRESAHLTFATYLLTALRKLLAEHP